MADEPIPTFSLNNGGRGKYYSFELDLFGDGTLCVDAEDEDSRVMLYFDRSHLEELRDWCEAALSSSSKGASSSDSKSEVSAPLAGVEG